MAAITIPLVAGWNDQIYYSGPTLPIAQAFGSILGDIIEVWHFNGSTWDLWDKDNAPNSTLTTMVKGETYYINCSSACVWEFDNGGSSADVIVNVTAATITPSIVNPGAGVDIEVVFNTNLAFLGHIGVKIYEPTAYTTYKSSAVGSDQSFVADTNTATLNVPISAQNLAGNNLVDIGVFGKRQPTGSVIQLSGVQKTLFVNISGNNVPPSPTTDYITAFMPIMMMGLLMGMVSSMSKSMKK